MNSKISQFPKRLINPLHLHVVTPLQARNLSSSFEGCVFFGGSTIFDKQVNANQVCVLRNRVKWLRAIISAEEMRKVVLECGMMTRGCWWNASSWMKKSKVSRLFTSRVYAFSWHRFVPTIQVILEYFINWPHVGVGKRWYSSNVYLISISQYLCL